MVGSVGCVKLARAAILKILVCVTIEATVVHPLHALRLFSAERHRHQKTKKRTLCIYMVVVLHKHEGFLSTLTA